MTTTQDDGLKISGLDDLAGKTPEELRAIVEHLDNQIRGLHQNDAGELRDLNEDETKAMNLCLDVRDAAVKKIDEHRRISEVLRNKPKAVSTIGPALIGGGEDPYANIRSLSKDEARDRALRVLDNRNASARLSDDEKTQVDKLVRRSADIARRVLITENDGYRNAFMKMVTDPNGALYLDDDERRALVAWNEYRAMSENTTTAGGFGIPVFIDPSIILTAQGSGNPFLEISRQVDVNTNQWKGVSSAGVTWAFQTEAAVTTDNSPTLAQPSVLVHMARGFIPYSLEIGQDYPAFADEMSTLLAEGYDELLIDKFTRGSGTGEPKGILTALSANTNVRVTVTTSGQIGSPDPYKVWGALGQRFRNRASWLMNVGVNNAIAQLGAANVFHAYTVSLGDAQVEQLRNRPVYESPYMPDVTTSTSSTAGLAVVGDFQNFVIARRGGMNVELVPHLTQQASAGAGVGMPTGQRGWFAYARIGSNSVNDLAFRLLANTG